MTATLTVARRAYDPPLVLLCSACRRGHVQPCEAEVEIDLVARGVLPELPPGCGACACACDSTTRIVGGIPEPGGCDG